MSPAVTRIVAALHVLDDRVLPRVAGPVQRGVSALATRFDRTQAALPGALNTVRRTRPLRMLNRLDEALVHLSPWRYWTSRPALAGLTVLVLLLSGISAVVLRPEAHTCARTAGPSIGVDFARVGPQVGDKVASYIAARGGELHTRAANCPDQLAYAVVSLSRYRRPAELAGWFGAAKPVRVLFRVPLPHSVTEVSQAPVRNLVADTLHAFEAGAAVQEKYATTFRQLYRQFPQTGRGQVNYLALYGEFIRSFDAQVKALRSGCACVFAVVVLAPVRELDALRQADGIRLVDVAPPTLSVTQLSFVGLLPEQRSTVDNRGLISPMGGRL